MKWGWRRFGIKITTQKVADGGMNRGYREAVNMSNKVSRTVTRFDPQIRYWTWSSQPVAYYEIIIFRYLLFSVQYLFWINWFYWTRRYASICLSRSGHLKWPTCQNANILMENHILGTPCCFLFTEGSETFSCKSLFFSVCVLPWRYIFDHGIGLIVLLRAVAALHLEKVDILWAQSLAVHTVCALWRRGKFLPQPGIYPRASSTHVSYLTPVLHKPG